MVYPGIVIRTKMLLRKMTNDDDAAITVRINPDSENKRKLSFRTELQLFHF